MTTLPAAMEGEQYSLSRVASNSYRSMPGCSLCVCGGGGGGERGREGEIEGGRGGERGVERER